MGSDSKHQYMDLHSSKSGPVKLLFRPIPLICAFILAWTLATTLWFASKPMSVGWIFINNGETGLNTPITAQGVLLTPWNESTALLEQGDRLTAINGYALSELANQRFGRFQNNIPWQHGDVHQWTLLRDNAEVTLDIPLVENSLADTLFLRRVGPLFFIPLLFTGLCILIYLRRPDVEAILPLLIFATAITAFTIVGFQRFRLLYLLRPLAYWLMMVPLWLAPVICTSAILHLLLVFPNRASWMERRSRLILTLIYGLPIVWILFIIFHQGLLTDNGLIWTRNWLERDRIVWRSLMALVVPLLFLAWRRCRHSFEMSQQFRILMASVLSYPVGMLLFFVLPGLIGLEHNFPGYLGGIFFIPTPIGLFVALTRYRLFAVDRLLNRSLVFTLVLGLAGLVYALLIGLSALFLQTRVSLPFGLLILVAIIVALQPVRQRVQKLINRLMYGQRDDPFAILTEANTILRSDAAPGAMLQQLVTHIGTALQVPFVEMRLPEANLTSQFGSAENQHRTWQTPLNTSGKQIGSLQVAQRDSSQSFNKVETSLLDTIAQQAADKIQSRQLKTDLISVRSDERKRLQQDLHDRLGPSLASVSMQLDVARNLVSSDPERAAQILQDLRGDTQSTVEEVRHILQDLRPSVIDELGLDGAIKAMVAERNGQQGVAIHYERLGNGGVISAEIETTLYQIVNEALLNVLKHAQASSAQIELNSAETITLSIEDDGIGLPSGNIQTGIGLASINRRVEKLGGQINLAPASAGGTALTVTLPARL